MMDDATSFERVELDGGDKAVVITFENDALVYLDVAGATSYGDGTTVSMTAAQTYELIEKLQYAVEEVEK